MMTKRHILNPSFQDSWHGRDWPSRIPHAEHLPQRHAGPQSAIRNRQSAIGSPRFLPASCHFAPSSPPPASLRFCVLHPHISQPGPEGASSILKKPEIGPHLPLPLCLMRHLLRLKILENPNFFATPPFLGRRAISLLSPANRVPLLRILCGELMANRNPATPGAIRRNTHSRESRRSSHALISPQTSRHEESKQSYPGGK